MKKILSTVFIGIFLFTTIGCGGEGVKQTDSKNSVEEKVQTSKKEVKKEEPKFQTASKGKVNTIENYCEFTITNTRFGKKINPPKPKDMYTYYEAKEPGTTYFDTTINIKSLLTEGLRSDEFLSLKIIYDGKYEYETFSIIEENGGSNFTYTNITPIEPLKKGMVHFIAEVPEEIEKNSKQLVAVVNSNNKEFRYVIR